VSVAVVSVRGVKQAVKLRVLASDGQAAALEETLQYGGLLAVGANARRSGVPQDRCSAPLLQRAATAVPAGGAAGDPRDWQVADAYAVLHATIDAPEAPLAEPVNGFVGVDMGIVNIATTSTGSRASGAPLNR